MTGLVQADAVQLPVADDSVDLIVTSPPYFALRSYRDGGEHYDGQIGSEANPQDFLEALWAVTAECVRVLKPSGSLWVNLGDKYAGSGGHNNSGIVDNWRNSTLKGVDTLRTALDDRLSSLTARGMPDMSPAVRASRRNAPDSYTKASGHARPKSLMGLPWRYAIGCIDDLGLILRAEVIWSKPNGLPESVKDRVRRSHEQWFHFTLEPRYFSALDEIREPHQHPGIIHSKHVRPTDTAVPDRPQRGGLNPLGKLPGSVWSIPSEPLKVPDDLGFAEHFAAFPQEWPRRLVLGWCPAEVCTACGEGRAPVVEKAYTRTQQTNNPYRADRNPDTGGRSVAKLPHGRADCHTTITGYACACPDNSAPSTPGVVLDPFAGTGTVPMVARALGRTGIGVDLSADYLRLASWRVFESGHASKSIARTNGERQGLLPL